MSKTIEYTQSDIEKYEVVTEILGLEDLAVVRQYHDKETGTHQLYCCHRWDRGVCPNCLQISDELHDYPKQRRIHDTLLRGEKVVLLFDSRRLNCQYCRKPFTQEVRDVVADCTYTYRLYEEIANPKRKQDVSTVAELYGVGYKLVERIFLKAGEAKLEARRQEPLQVTQLGIDEISEKKGMGTMPSSSLT
jgi:transposase